MTNAIAKEIIEDSIDDTYKKLDEKCEIVLGKIKARKKKRAKKETKK